ncbi:HAMP domain-containing histidine kinase [Sphingobacterium sp. SRCM116780]|uniref:sensor histidine kinase n=1 Tax=Sphingobacterium sp. SRCM116780 TaxID=2907623 RepID=UPI001F1BB23B|nr:HAMP domain-containing sensor histidine kinase [Sphingobacterium sp. SRCM116780]UIR54724.1 HAMP domain-containing histidine kinase [Sphingobacterium sp. SRCM116780]
MKKSLKNYTIRYITIMILIVIALWATLFYAYIMEEVYDNVDDGLKNQKIEIIRAAYENESILQTADFGINQFKITKSLLKEKQKQKNIFKNDFIYMPYDEEMEPYRILSTNFYGKDNQLYDLEIRTSTVEEDELKSDLATALIILYIFIIISIYFINRIVFYRAFKPFYQILDKLEKYQFGKTKEAVHIASNVREFDILNIEIDKMIDRNEKIFKQQKLFIENASHELQTPLAISTNKLELLLEDEQLNENQLIKISETKEALDRMIKLNKALLMLSRIENNQFEHTVNLNFNSLIQQLCHEFSEILDFKGVTVEVHEHDIFQAELNSDLANILLSNLIRNAIYYNKQNGGLIRIDISKEKLSIANSGKQTALHGETIFDRFRKENTAISSNGLGLSIVKTIVETNKNLKITYSYLNNLHTFSLYKL